MNLSSIYSGEIQERAVSKASLDDRLAINRRYQSRDFHAWLMDRLNVQRGEKILDVGCGTGAQALRFLDCIGPKGTVSACDINAESIDELQQRADNDPRLQAVASDMADLPELISNTFSQKKYTLAQAAYSVYYSPQREMVMRTMAESIYDFGRVAIFNPIAPHGLVDLASRFSEIPPAVMDSLNFPSRLTELFREIFWDVRVDYFQSEVKVTSLEDFITFYQATTYYSAEAEGPLTEYAKDQIDRFGAITYEKNGFLIQGSATR